MKKICIACFALAIIFLVCSCEKKTIVKSYSSLKANMLLKEDDRILGTINVAYLDPFEQNPDLEWSLNSLASQYKLAKSSFVEDFKRHVSSDCSSLTENGFKILDRGQTDKIFSELEFQVSNLSSPEKVAGLGWALNASYIAYWEEGSVHSEGIMTTKYVYYPIFNLLNVNTMEKYTGSSFSIPTQVWNSENGNLEGKWFFDGYYKTSLIYRDAGRAYVTPFAKGYPLEDASSLFMVDSSRQIASIEIRGSEAFVRYSGGSESTCSVSYGKIIEKDVMYSSGHCYTGKVGTMKVRTEDGNAIIDGDVYKNGDTFYVLSGYSSSGNGLFLAFGR